LLIALLVVFRGRLRYYQLDWRRLILGLWDCWGCCFGSFARFGRLGLEGCCLFGTLWVGEARGGLGVERERRLEGRCQELVGNMWKETWDGNLMLLTSCWLCCLQVSFAWSFVYFVTCLAVSAFDVPMSLRAIRGKDFATFLNQMHQTTPQ
jgi:hypothetical protein